MFAQRLRAFARYSTRSNPDEYLNAIPASALHEEISRELGIQYCSNVINPSEQLLSKCLSGKMVFKVPFLSIPTIRNYSKRSINTQYIWIHYLFRTYQYETLLTEDALRSLNCEKFEGERSDPTYLVKIGGLCTKAKKSNNNLNVIGMQFIT